MFRKAKSQIFLFLGVLFIQSGCGGGSPTGPEDLSKAEHLRSLEEVSSVGSRRRPPVRSVPPRSNAGLVRLGAWGGEHALLVLRGSGGGLEYDCASGTIDQPLAADARGFFVATGTHVRGHGGPIIVGEPPDSHPARYTGWTDGRSMTLTVTMIDSGERVGTFTLAFESPARIFRCL